MSKSRETRAFISIVLWLIRSVLIFGDVTTFQRVFQTEETVRNSKAVEMHHRINFKANPCTDFYEFACGNWESKNTQQSEQQKRTDIDLLRLLEETAHRQDSALARHAKDFFKSCLTAQAQQSQQQQNFLSEFIKENGGFPAVPGSNWQVYHQNYDWLQVIAKLRKNYGIDILIGLRVDYSIINVQQNSIYFSQPSTLIPHELCTRKRRDIPNSSYEDIAKNVVKQLKLWLAVGNEESERIAADIINLDHELCGSMRDLELWDGNIQLFKANFTRKTLSYFGDLYKLDFEGYVSSSFGQTISMPVYMAAPDYYIQLRRTLDVRNNTQVANYIMYRALAALTFPLDDKPTTRPVYCLNSVKRLLPSALGELYARQYTSEESRQQLTQLYEQLKDALKKSISAKWLEEGSRRIAQHKLRSLEITMSTYEKSVPSRIQLDRTNYWRNLRQLLIEVQSKQLNRLFEEGLPAPADPIESYETRVRYRSVQRRLELGWALLQPPYYDTHYGQALRYATFGTVLAEEMVKPFDELHWSVDLLEHDSWDRLTAWRYHNRSDCFSHQVEEYLRTNATATQLLIGRSAGLNIAFHAYLTWLGFQEPNNDFTRLSKETLPGLNYSNTALFFLAYAQQQCHPKENNRDQADPSSMLTYSVQQSHSWKRLKVNGPLRNLADFALEFHCPVGSPMNPADKCIIY